MEMELEFKRLFKYFRMWILIFLIFTTMILFPLSSWAEQIYTDFSIDLGELDSPYYLDAENEAFWFIDDADVMNYVVIENFSNDDVIQVPNAADDEYSFANNGEDVNIIYNNNGIINRIVLLDMVTPTALIFSETSFEDYIGFDVFRLGNYDLVTWYEDADGDGYGNLYNSLESKLQPEGYVTDNTDCNDGNFDIHPGAVEYCNGEDDDCNGVVDELCDIPDKIILEFPSGTMADNTPSFTCYESPSCTWYKLVIWDSSKVEIHNKWYKAEDISSGGLCLVTLSSEFSDGSYQWWVRGWNENGNGPWSDGMNFTVISDNIAGPPPATSLIAPGSSVSNPVVFTWSAVSNSIWYQLWVNNSDGETVKRKWYKAQNIGCETGSKTCAISMETEVLDPGTYRWWVQTWNEEGYGDWSSAMNFSVIPVGSKPAVAELISPDATISDLAAFTWNAVSNASWYYLWVDDESGTQIKRWYTAEDAGCESGAGTCSVSSSDPTSLTGDCSWWIRTYNDYGYGPWSTGMNFSINADDSWQ